MKTIKVVAAIIHEHHQILIARRSYGDLKGYYEFPGGKVKPGETTIEAIKREIFEELHVHINVESFFMNVQHDYETFHLDMDCFICTLIDHDVKLDSHSEIRWISGDEEDIQWCPADLKVMDQLQCFQF